VRAAVVTTPGHERAPQAEILTFPGGHFTTSEYPDLLAAAIGDIAERHGVGTPARDNSLLDRGE
jgi:hypothetical protein